MEGPGRGGALTSGDPLHALAASIEGRGESTPVRSSLPEPSDPELSVRRVLVAVAVLLALGVGGAFALREAGATATRRAAPWFAPYVDATLTPTYPFEAPSADPARGVVLGFVVSAPNAPCSASWGGAYSLTQAASSLDLDRRIAQLRANGASAIASFGGQRGGEPASACKSVQGLTALYTSVVSRYHLDTIDLDVEGAALEDTAAANRRALAIAALRREVVGKGGHLAVWLTLPVTTSGLEPSAVEAVRAMLKARVTLAGVNAMTMDFGSPGKPQRSMLDAAESALRATHSQLDALYREVGVKLGSRQLWARLGATAMIGGNDVPGEVFTLADARGLVAFARGEHLGRLSTWSLNRDVECGAAFAQAAVLSNTCSGVVQSPLQFSRIFGALGGSPAAVAASSPVDSIPELPQTAIDNPARSPYPVWRANASYRAGYKVVWHGDVYEAKWFSQSQMPDMPVQSQWDTPWVLVGPVLPGEHPPKIPRAPAGLYPTWSSTATYRAGERVLYGGLPYRAKWYTHAEPPVAEGEGAEASPWQPLYTIPGEPKPVPGGG